MPASPDFVITRYFAAPRAALFAAFTEPARMQQWMSPQGTTVLAAKMDFRQGGSYHYGMGVPNAPAMWGKCVYREIAAPERLVYVQFFSDEQGGVTRHPMSASWPIEMLTTLTFSEKDGGTEVTVTWSPLNPTDEERATFDSAHDGMTQGWSGMLDKLDAYLAG